MKLRTWLLSKTQPRTSLHFRFNIPGNNCSFLPHDIMLMYTIIKFSFQNGLFTFTNDLAATYPTSEHTHRRIYTTHNNYVVLSAVWENTHPFFVQMIQNRLGHPNYHKGVGGYASIHNPGDSLNSSGLIVTFSALALQWIQEACSR